LEGSGSVRRQLGRAFLPGPWLKASTLGIGKRIGMDVFSRPSKDWSLEANATHKIEFLTTVP
jgi:hypothetical protein